MSQIFSSVPQTKISRSRHNLSHQVKASFDPGKLNPILTELARPADTWNCSLEQFVRTMPMIAPVMDMVDIKVDAFFVPIRLIWDDFEDFITLGLTGEFEATPPTIARSTSASVSDLAPIIGVGGLADYLNFPSIVNATTMPELDALPFRAYQFIYNEYYLNENLDTPIPVIKSSGKTELSGTSTSPGYLNNFHLQNRGWRKDYFTSALPYPQKGPAVRIPFADLDIRAAHVEGGLAPLRLCPSNILTGAIPEGDDNFFSDPDAPVPPVTVSKSTKISMEDEYQNTMNLSYDSGLEIYRKNRDPFDPNSHPDYPTIEELRYAEVLQEFYEANARGGTRPKEYYLNIWHTRSKDSRLDRPEYLGGYRGPITISDIDQTSQSATTAQGTLAGKGVSAGGQKLFRYHVPEWGIIMVIMSVQPKSAYYQGFRRWNLYKDAFDWPNPFFANLGEQEIYNKEIYTDRSDGKDDNTFGYTPRYSECKFIPDTVHGQFRSTLDYWHLARKFGSRPNLNSAFVHVQPSEMSRIFPSQVDNNDKFVGTFFFHISCKMYLPYWGVPRLLHSI